MGFLLPQRRPLGNTFRDHSIFIERQDLPGEIRRSDDMFPAAGCFESVGGGSSRCLALALTALPPFDEFQLQGRPGLQARATRISPLFLGRLLEHLWTFGTLRTTAVDEAGLSLDYPINYNFCEA
jgi:hypothetical protein